MRRMLRRTIALTAAYALALQAILALSVAASLAASHGVAICRNNDAVPGAPAHQKCEACLAGHCAAAAGKAESASAAAWPARATRAPTLPRAVARVTSPRRIAAHAARAPPRA